MKMFKIGILILALWGVSFPAAAVTFDLEVKDDLSLAENMPDMNLNFLSGSTQYWWAGDNTREWYKTLYWVDFSPVLSKEAEGLVVENLSFFAYNNYNQGGWQMVHAALGNYDRSSTEPTWNNANGDYGPVLASSSVGPCTLDSFIEWDLSGMDSSAWQDGMITLYLFGDTKGVLSDFEPRWSPVGGHAPFATVTMASPVPEPATMVLLGSGLIGLAGTTRRKHRRKGDKPEKRS